ncbi:OmpA family protein [Bacteroides pyogenes]|uniref:OmpA family protein n=1 Tax=Bacteroides pyogenes TaxID=310300 RepID=UPI003B42BAD0
MKKIFIFAMFGFLAVSASSQNLLQGSKVFDNWSMGINVGGVTPLTHSAFFKNMRPAVGVEIGKQLTPIVGFTIEGMGYINTTESHTAFDNSNVSLLGRVNLNNLFGSYQGAPRCFEMEAVAGAGWLHFYGNVLESRNFLSSKVGLNFNFNLGERKAWTLALKPALVYALGGNQAMPSLKFNANNATVEVLAGLTYHFRGSNGEHHMSFGRAYDQAEVDILNARVNELRGQAQDTEASLMEANRRVGELQQQLEECRNKKPIVQTVTEKSQMLESVVTFRQGRTTIDASQLPNVERIAVYLNKYPESTVVIKGYASPEGSQEVNDRIARQRAEVVKNTLIKRYKISAARISAEGQGVGDMFSEPDWNRVSICTIKEAQK